MAARTLKELIASTGGRLILAGAGAVVALSALAPQWPTYLHEMQAWVKWIITALASFGLVVVARTALPSVLGRDGAGGDAFVKHGARVLAASMGAAFLIGVLWNPDAVGKLTFYSLLASVAMLSTIVLAAASLAEARSQTDSARQLVEATRRQRQAIEGANEVFGNLKSVLGEMDDKGILTMAGQVRSLQKDLAWRLRWVLVALGVIAAGVAVAVLLLAGIL